MEIKKETKGLEMICHVMNMDTASFPIFHFHENYEICQPLNVPCDFLVDGVLVHAEPGDILCIASSVIHRFLPRHPGSRIRVLQFPMRILMQPGASAEALRTCIRRQDIEKIPGLENAVLTLFALMEQEEWVYTGQKNSLLQSLITSFYLLLLKHFPSDAPQDLRKDADLFFRAVSYVNAHFTDDFITVEHIAGTLYVSREKLSNVFLLYAGISCKEYIHALRIKHVNQLLLEGADITTASLKSGFASIRTFNNVYKSVMGMTPTEYLKHQKQQAGK